MHQGRLLDGEGVHLRAAVEIPPRYVRIDQAAHPLISLDVTGCGNARGRLSKWALYLCLAAETGDGPSEGVAPFGVRPIHEGVLDVEDARIHHQLGGIDEDLGGHILQIRGDTGAGHGLGGLIADRRGLIDNERGEFDDVFLFLLLDFLHSVLGGYGQWQKQACQKYRKERSAMGP